jgi:tetratricopeptide (TPR) repeat protein
MSKPTPPPVPPAGSFWLPFAAIGLIGALTGSTITYLVLRPGLNPTAAPAAAAMAVGSDPTAHLPSPDLTAGQTPAQADRTLGNFFYDHQNWPQTINHYEAALRQGVDDADIRTDLGNAYRFIGRFDDALAQYTRAQQLNPLHEFSLFNQGGLYLEDLKQPAKAIAIWQEYLVRFPTGQNVQAARQLIAQTQGGASGAVTPEVSAPGQTSSAEKLILQQIKSGQAKSGRP